MLGLLAVAGAVHAEDAFVGSRGFRAGLHQDQASDSPILKLVPAGSALQVLKRAEQSSLVRDGEGVQGWIDNSYLATEPPAESAQGEAQRKRIEELEKQLEQSRAEIVQMETRLTGSGKAGDDFVQMQQLKRQNQDLDQQLKQEKLRAGETQVELTELRKRIGMDSDTEALLAEIASLQAENRNLRINSGVAEGDTAGAPGREDRAGSTELAQFAAYAIVVLLLLGFGGGVYVMDFLNRRRHGGFRV